MLYLLNVKCFLLIVILRMNSSTSKVQTLPISQQSLDPHLCLFHLPLGPCCLTRDSVQDKCGKMLSVALKADGERAWARNGLSFAPATKETAFSCFQNSSSPVIPLTQSSQNAIKRDQDAELRQYILKKMPRRNRVELRKCLF